MGTSADRTKDWHEKPPRTVRSVKHAMARADRQRKELPRVVQVHAHDWDLVILCDALREAIAYQRRQERVYGR